jgi:hypothetical protein
MKTLLDEYRELQKLKVKNIYQLSRMLEIEQKYFELFGSSIK